MKPFLSLLVIVFTMLPIQKSVSQTNIPDKNCDPILLKKLTRKAIEYNEKFKYDSAAVFSKKADVLITVADINKKEGKYKEELNYCKKALEYYQKSLRIRIDVLGEQHPSVADNFNNVGEI